MNVDININTEHIHKNRDRQTDRQTDGQTDRWTDIERVAINTDRQIYDHE